MTEVNYSFPSCYGSGHMLDPKIYSNLAYDHDILRSFTNYPVVTYSGRPRILEMLLLKEVLLNCEYCTKCLSLLNTSIVDAPYDECRLADNIIYDREPEFRY